MREPKMTTTPNIKPGMTVAYTHSPFEPVGTVESLDEDFAYVRENTLDAWDVPVDTRPALLLRIPLTRIREAL